ncbi:L,D-transpeptidase family protein [Streptomyces sp. 3214.6]|uniref:L,D-transpeptidase family protein n=1 Tax=Streptomyces sp. 3214.6 TaxID=1882757 RepID=UPI003FA77400
MRHGEVRRVGAATVTCGLLLVVLAACGGSGAEHGRDSMPRAGAEGSVTPPSVAPATGVPGVGERLQRQIPAGSRQVVAVYGDGKDSATATVVFYAKRGPVWERVRTWPAHNGKKGWTAEHYLGDDRSPVGVFTLSAAAGVLDDPGTRLPYTQSEDYAAPRWWDQAHWHDFDYVIAIDYNRVKGTPPDDAEQPLGEERGGGIWLHLDHGDGTSACVSLPRAAMEYLLRTLDPDQHPVVVMGDRAALRS